jgi:hypothetical protein
MKCNIKKPIELWGISNGFLNGIQKKKHLQDLPGDAWTDDDAPVFILFSLCVFQFQFYR